MADTLWENRHEKGSYVSVAWQISLIYVYCISWWRALKSWSHCTRESGGRWIPEGRQTGKEAVCTSMCFYLQHWGGQLSATPSARGKYWGGSTSKPPMGGRLLSVVWTNQLLLLCLDYLIYSEATIGQFWGKKEVNFPLNTWKFGLHQTIQILGPDSFPLTLCAFWLQ